MKLAACLLVALLALACGGSSPSSPAASPGASFSVSGVLFYDEDGDGSLDDAERVRLPGVQVSAGGQSAATDPAGEFTIGGVPATATTLSLPAAGLPPYFEPGRLPTLALPQPAGSLVAVPVVLALAGNRPNVYLALGDSITWGQGATRRLGWPVLLERRLQALWGAAAVTVDGVPSSLSPDGVARLPAALAEWQPAYTLVLYGTNDWSRCGFVAPEECFTVERLREMIRLARAAGSWPVVGTLPPVDPTATAPRVADRNHWVKLQNELIRTMVRAEGAVLADPWSAFGPESAWPDLFFDFLHPNDAGHERIAEAFARAITGPRGTQ